MNKVINYKAIAAVATAGVAGWFGGYYYKGTNTLQIIENDSNVGIQNRTYQIMRYGFPSLDEIRSYEDFVLSYDRRTRVAKWVFEHLTREKIRGKNSVDRSLCTFMEDKSIDKRFRASNSDYLNSGFDRGHLAAAGNHKLEQKHCDQTFVLSNIAPQIGVGFNRHKWNELEKYVRSQTNKFPNIYVCTGPLFIPELEKDGKMYVKYQVLGKNLVSVPTHFFKVVVKVSENNEFHLESFILPNRPIDDRDSLTKYYVTPDVIEKYSGLLFFDQISKSNLASVNGIKTTYV